MEAVSDFMNNNKSFWGSLNQVMDAVSGVGLEEKAKKEYKEARRAKIIITFIVLAVCGGLLYLHFKGYNCTIIAIILAVLDILAFLFYLLLR